MAKYSRTTAPDNRSGPVGRVTKYHGMHIGYVKANADVQKMGRLQVWIPEFGSQENDKNGWFTISYSSPFAGATSSKGLGTNTQTEKDTMTSYGFWAVPPDLDNQVIVMFANGDPTLGVMMGCLYQQFMNKMVPGYVVKDEKLWRMLYNDLKRLIWYMLIMILWQLVHI